jgi:flagellar hook assembly protein FlgD
MEFTMADQRTKSLRIFDMKGRLVRTLISDERMNPGQKAIPWDGKDDRGRPAPTGTNAYSLVAGDSRETKKMMLMK